MAEPTSLRVPANVNETVETVAEAPATSAAALPVPAAEPVRRKRSVKRPVLFALLPIALVAGGYYYVTGGQIMETDNAYLQADMVGVSTDVAGIVASVDVQENEAVKTGQVLFQLKSDSFRITLEGAQAKLEAARNQLLNLKAGYKQTLAQIAQVEADIPYYQTVLERQEKLISNAAASHATYDEAKHDLDAAGQKVSVAKALAEGTLAQLGGNADKPIETYPAYLEAKADVDDAQRELDDTVVRAPFDGVVTNVNALQVGSYLEEAQQGFSLVSTSNMWISANPKETELTYVKPGQTVSISVDAYPGEEWTGKVASVSPASGASFSLLPAQNTSGNWVKVVQRIPMRVSIDPAEGKPPLRVGMSAVVEINTGHARGLPDSIAKLLGQFTAHAHE
ncbi:membrane fusion protein (multidrug efflux system) [Pararhizobium capsulatum DSM 1112]|uniref:Membrane fusion protein (Multidrug efflux system) n=1 Tax=Pararhizobium capsulatum DSM 1112 TaxID=1121113 RepID=A0ABU0BJA4_9HYPH|nr:HlyD family secretion protein [Pararhizobium capsulatum]MDQ0318340.1 membrane fusion protein (multidrug efflux system) [Pararhizobium capsulatum DSM 1112]